MVATKEVSINGRLFTKKSLFSLSEKGVRVCSLVKLDFMLKNHNDSQIHFGMSDNMVSQYAEERERLCDSLGFSKDEKLRDRKIKYYRKMLDQRFIPWWKNFDVSL